MPNQNQFSIEAKLKITGVDVKGNINAGTLKFDIDTSALKKLVVDAGIAAAKVKKKFDNIKLKKLNIEVSKSSLRIAEAQIRRAVERAVGKAKVNIKASISGGTKVDPFKAQRQAAGKLATSMKTLHDLTKSVNTGFRSLIRTLANTQGLAVGGKIGVGGVPPQLGGAAQLPPFPAGTTTISGAQLGQQLTAQQRMIAFIQQQAAAQKQLSSTSAAAAQRRLADLDKIQRKLDQLLKKERMLGAQIAKAGGAGNIPPGGFGAVGIPGAGGFDPGNISGAADLARAMGQIEINTKGANRQMIELDQLAFEVGRKAAAFRGVAIAINSVINASQAAAKFIIDFNDSLIEINKILQFSNASLKRLGDELFTLSAGTGVASEETLGIAEAFARAGLAGRGYGTITQLTDRALTGLQGTTLDANQATEIIIQTLQQVEGGARGLNKELVTTSKLFDVLGRAEDITASRATDVQQAFKRSAASIFATGATIEQATAIISVLQERTQRGGEVIGTALKTLASRIASSSSEASRALQGIGVATVDSEGNLRNLFDVLLDTAVAFRRLSESEQANIAVKTAGVRQVEVFRAALLDFNRVQNVQRQLVSATGDAARKQAAEQTKLSNVIARLQAGLRQLVKQASEGLIGQAFVGAIKAAETLITSIARFDKALGGAVSTFTGVVAIFAAFKAVIPLFRGMIRAFKFFLGAQKEAQVGFQQMGVGVSNVSNTIQGQMNASLQKTASIMVQLNTDMKAFALASEQAAVQAERLALAKQKQALQGPLQTFHAGTAAGGRSVGGGGVGIFATSAARDPRSQALIQAAGRGQIKDLQAAAKQFPQLFTAAELKGIENMSKGIRSAQMQAGILGKTLTHVGNGVRTVLGSTLAWGLGLSVLSGALDDVSGNTKGFSSTLAGLGATIAQGAAFGALGGPVGILIGAIGGALVGFGKIVLRQTDVVQQLKQRYIELGLVQTEHGEITSEVSNKLDKALRNLQAFKDFDFKLDKQDLEDFLNPKAARQRREKLATTREQEFKGLKASFDAGASDQVKANKILESLTNIVRERTGVQEIDLADPTLLRKATPALENVSEEALRVMEEEAALMAEEFGLSGDKIRDIFDSNIETAKKFQLSPAQIEEARSRLEDSVGGFINALDVLIPASQQIDKAGKDGALDLKAALEDISKGVGGVDTEKIVQQAIGQARRLRGVRGETGEALTTAEIRGLLQQAQGFAAQRREIGAPGVGRALPEILKALPAELQRAIAASEIKDLANTFTQQAQVTKEAVDSLRTEFPLTKIAGFIDKPVNKLELVLRDFAADFGRQITKLTEAQLQAITPQEQLADALAKNAKMEADAARRNAALGAADAIRHAQDVFSREIGSLGQRVFKRDQEVRAELQRRTGMAVAPELDLTGLSGETADVLKEITTRTRGDVAKELFEALRSAADKIRQEGLVDPDVQRDIISNAVRSIPDISALQPEQIEKIKATVADLSKELIKLDTEAFQAVIKSNRAQLDALKKRLAEEDRLLAIDDRRRQITAMNARAAMEELTGIRRLVAERDLESRLLDASITSQRTRISQFDAEIAALKAQAQSGDDRVAALDKIEVLEKRRTETSLKLEEQLAARRIAAIRATLAATDEAIDMGRKEADFQRGRIGALGEINSLLAVNRTQLEEFNASLEVSSAQFRQTQAELAAETAIVNAVITDEAEKKARLADIEKRAVQAALDQAKAEAQLIKERREAIKQVAEQLVSNQQDQVNAQREVLEATRALSEAFEGYLQAVDGAILATTRYNLGLQLAEVQAIRVTGGFAGIRDELGAVQEAFRDAEKLAGELGASEKTLVELRRESINQQLALFNQLLQEQSQLARSFFTSATQDQANLFLGIREAQAIASDLGGSFDSFKKLGEGAINDLGAQLLALPQETRQRIVSALETLKTIGGTVGGFNADELLTAIETAALGVSKEGLDVDPLFEVQERIASLQEEQAKLATEQLISANDGVQTAKEQLETAQAAKDLAEIQLERVKEEGEKLRGKLGELRGELKTVLLQQDANAKMGFNAVTSAVNRAVMGINTLPDALSVKVAQAFREVLQTAGLTVPGLTTQPQAPVSTAGSRGGELARDQRRFGTNGALQAQFYGQSGQGVIIPALASNNIPAPGSNVPDNSTQQRTNDLLDKVLTELESLNTISTNSDDALQAIRDSQGTTPTTAAATVAQPFEFNVTVDGEQRVTVTGFEAGVTRVAQALADTFGGFATTAEAEAAARQIIEPIITELINRGILQRNQVT